MVAVFFLDLVAVFLKSEFQFLPRNYAFVTPIIPFSETFT
jgi:hypothetical protein